MKSSLSILRETFAIPLEPELRDGFNIASVSNSLCKRRQASSAFTVKILFGDGAFPFSKASRIKCLLVALMACSRVIPESPNSSLIRPITLMLTSEQGWITPSICSSRNALKTSSSEVMFTTKALSAYLSPTALGFPSAAMTYIPNSLAFFITGSCKMPAASTKSLFCITFSDLRSL